MAFENQLIFWPDSPVTRQDIGGKAFALAQLSEGNVPIPDWFVVNCRAVEHSMNEKGALPLREVAEGARLPETIRQAIQEAVNALAGGENIAVAVRSSAIEEDSDEHSWAGQMDSFLMVQPDDVCDRVVDVWRSLYSQYASDYRKSRGIDEAPRPPAVLIQRMVLADCAGVAFSTDPVTGRRSHCIVSAVRGAGSALVDGETDADTFTIDRRGSIVSRSITEQQYIHELNQTGLTKRRLHPPDKEPAVSDDDALAVADLARRAADFFGKPQDIEWAISDGTLFLLQSRPITTLRRQPDPDGRTILWDNSNIAESYSGVTTPLTFSFARRAYTSVYQSFCRVMKVDEDVILDHAETFESMIGLIRGRIYYNLQSWYNMLALLPGFRFNRAFMEDMMGVSERMPPEHLPDAHPIGAFAKTTDLMRLIRSATALVNQHRNLPESIDNFQKHLNNVLTPPEPGVEYLRLDELAAYYRRIEKDLLAEWDVPIVNDFMTMIFSGLSKLLLESRVEDDAESLHNRLMIGLDDVISVEPARRIREMASVVTGDDALIETLKNGTVSEVEQHLEHHPILRTLYNDYLDRFSDRCLDELKLESPTIRDEPQVLFRAIGGLASRLQKSDLADTQPREKHMRQKAEEELTAAFKNMPIKKQLIQWSLRHARDRIAARENLRFDRTRVFGMARRLFLEMGRRLVAEAVLDNPRDVFYLEVHEIVGFVDGTATTTDLRGLASVRRDEFAEHRSAPPPADRFTTSGAVPIGNLFETTAKYSDSTDGEERQGTGGCPGVVRAHARIVTDARGAALKDNEILVAERTDPGWVALFTSAAGLIVEHGNMLSHAAIVARELGIPAVVSLPEATSWLKTGDLVELNGETGSVRRINPSDSSA